MKNKHLSYDERLEIESGLKDNLSFKQIAKNIDRDCTTISKEIKKERKNNDMLKKRREREQRQRR